MQGPYATDKKGERIETFEYSLHNTCIGQIFHKNEFRIYRIRIGRKTIHRHIGKWITQV